VADTKTYTAEQKERIEELASAYVLGALADDEAGWNEFEELLSSNDTYLAEILEPMLDSAAALAFAAPEKEAPPEVRDELLKRVRYLDSAERTEGRLRGVPMDASHEAIPTSVLHTRLKKRTRILLSVSVVAGLLICYMGALLIQKSANITARDVAVNDLKKQRDSLFTAATSLRTQDSLARALFSVFNEKNSSIVTLANTTQDQPMTHRVYFSREQQMIYVMKESLPPLEKGKIYELWLIKGSAPPVPVGTFDINSLEHIYSFKAPSADADAFAISIEPEGGSKSPQGPVIMVGKVASKL
jgi:anti-sigma-K factor RskA